MKWLPFIGWTVLSPDDAAGLGLSQPYRWKWSVFEVMWFDRGFTLFAKAEPMI